MGPTTTTAHIASRRPRDAKSYGPRARLNRTSESCESRGKHGGHLGYLGKRPGRCQVGPAELTLRQGHRHHLQGGAHSTSIAFTPSVGGFPLELRKAINRIEEEHVKGSNPLRPKELRGEDSHEY